MEKCPEKMSQWQQETDTYTGDGPEIKSTLATQLIWYSFLRLCKTTVEVYASSSSSSPNTQNSMTKSQTTADKKNTLASTENRSCGAGKLTGIHLPVNALVWKMMILPSALSISTERASGITKAEQWTGNLNRRQRTVFLGKPQQQEKNVQHQNTRESKAESHMPEVQILRYKVIRVLS